MRKYDELMIERFGERYTKYRNDYNNKNTFVKPEFPLEIDIDLMDNCNLKCPACHSIGRVRTNAVMDKSVLIKVVKECEQYHLPAVNIGGCCEPLLTPDYVIEMVQLFKDAGVMDIFLHTNGLLLTEKVSKGLIDAGVTFLCLSIDAATEETYKKMRGASLDKLMTNIDKFIELRGSNPFPALRVSFLPTSLNAEEEEEFLRFWQNKVDYAEVQNYIINYDSQPNVSRESAQSVVGDILKRVAVLAPDFLCTGCGGTNVQYAIDHNDTLAKYGSIKNYWDTL